MGAHQEAAAPWLRLVDAMAAPALAVDPQGRVTGWNTAAEHAWGWSASQRVGRDLREIVAPRAHPLVDRICRGVAEDVPLPVCTAGGDVDTHQVVSAPFHDPAGQLGAMVVACSGEPAEGWRDAGFRSLIQHASDLILVSDAEGTIRYVSPAARRILGRSPADVAGSTPIDLVHLDDVEHVAASFAEKAGLPGPEEPIEFRVRHADGSWRWLEGVTTNLLEDDAVAGMVINARDVTDRKELESQLAHLALHDPLTGLPNRALLTDRLTVGLERLRRQSSTLTVLMLDLDRFKEINDSLGHEFGDRLLVAVAERLASIVRPVDTVARLGGDEFVVVCQGSTEGESARRIAERITNSFAEPFEIGEHRIQITPSIGMATTTQPDVRPGDLLHDADVAMYRAKHSGRGRFEPFDEAMRAHIVERFRVEAALQRAVDHGEFALRYQPVLALDPGGVVGIEALVRWHHPDEGVLLPDDFLPLAEDTELILPLGRWVLRQACGTATRVAAGRPSGTCPVVGVNLSARQLADPSVTDDIAEALDATGAQAGDLLLEVPVHALDRAGSRDAVARLKSQGVQVAIDDFGAGDWALGHLRSLPVDVVKIARPVIARLPADRADAAMLCAVIGVADALGITVVAKGVERPEQLDHLRRLGCEAAQGFHLAAPVEAEALPDLLR